jgi:transcriptional regulator with XRE-family HTH domain
MVKISELKTADEVRAGDMQDLEYRREYERTRLANDVAIKVIQYRVKHRLSQAALGRLLGMRQPNVSRLESGDHEPSLATLSKLAEVLDQDFSVEVKPGRLRLRQPGDRKSRRTEATVSALAGRVKKNVTVSSVPSRSRLAQAASADSAGATGRKPATAAVKSRVESPRGKSR